MNAVNDRENHPSINTESDNNANSDTRNGQNNGAIPKTPRSNDTVKKSVSKHNNNHHDTFKMGLGNGNDSTINFINLVNGKDSACQINTNECVANYLIEESDTFHNRSSSLCANGVGKDCKCDILCSNEIIDSRLSSPERDKNGVSESNFNQLSNTVDIERPGPSGNNIRNIRSDLSPSYDKSSSASSINSNVNIDSDNDSSSCSDEGCVYTYKGGGYADLPDSFFIELRGSAPDDGPLFPFNKNNHPEPPVRPVDRNSSPEMDYLEMDFDPGPSCEADSESSVDLDLEEQTIDITTDEIAIKEEPQSTNTVQANLMYDLEQPSTSSGIRHSDVHANLSRDITNQSFETQMNTSDSSISIEQTTYEDSLEPLFFNELSDESPSSVMLLDEKEMLQKQFSSLTNSGTVTNAVLNALLLLGKLCSRLLPEWAKQFSQSQEASEQLDLCQYLMACSNSFPNHEDIVHGLKEISGDSVYARFFPTWPEKNLSLSNWLKYWLDQNVIPILTINQQPTSIEWQHRTVFGVTTEGIFLSDPVECVSEDSLSKKLYCDSVLHIKRNDILRHWNPSMDLGLLYSIEDTRWHDLNVLGKVVHLIRSSYKFPVDRPGSIIPSYLPIPTSICAGVTLVVDINNPASEVLKYHPNLPVKNIEQ